MGWHPDGPPTGVYGAPFLSDLERPAMAAAAKSFAAPTTTPAAAKTCPAPTPAEEEGVRFVNMGGPPDSSYLDRLCGLAGFMAGQVIPLSWWLPGKAGPP
jgi:hypothetical protein